MADSTEVSDLILFVGIDKASLRHVNTEEVSVPVSHWSQDNLSAMKAVCEKSSQSPLC